MQTFLDSRKPLKTADLQKASAPLPNGKHLSSLEGQREESPTLAKLKELNTKYCSERILFHK